MSADINEEGIGLRSFHLRKEKAVERAIEKIRHRLGEKWQEIPSEDIDILMWALGETWAMMSYNAWSDTCFSCITINGINKIIEIGRDARDHKKPGPASFEEIHQLLAGLEN